MASIEGAPQQGDEVNKSSSAATGNVCNSATIGQEAFASSFSIQQQHTNGCGRCIIATNKQNTYTTPVDDEYLKSVERGEVGTYGSKHLCRSSVDWSYNAKWRHANKFPPIFLHPDLRANLLRLLRKDRGLTPSSFWDSEGKGTWFDSNPPARSVQIQYGHYRDQGVVYTTHGPCPHVRSYGVCPHGEDCNHDHSDGRRRQDVTRQCPSLPAFFSWSWAVSASDETRFVPIIFVSFHEDEVMIDEELLSTNSLITDGIHVIDSSLDDVDYESGDDVGVYHANSDDDDIEASDKRFEKQLAKDLMVYYAHYTMEMEKTAQQAAAKYGSSLNPLPPIKVRSYEELRKMNSDELGEQIELIRLQRFMLGICIDMYEECWTNDAISLPQYNVTAQMDDTPESDTEEMKADDKDILQLDAEAMEARALEGFTSPSQVSPKFAVDDIVSVQPRTWPGINKEGGVGRVTAVYVGGDSVQYDITYLFGTRDKRVDEDFVSLRVDSSTARPSRSTETTDYSELNIDNDGNDISSLSNKKRKGGTADRGQAAASQKKKGGNNSSSSRTKMKKIPKKKAQNNSLNAGPRKTRTTTNGNGKEVSYNMSKAKEDNYKNHVNNPLALIHASQNSMAKTMLLLGQKHASRISWKIDIVNDPDCKYLTCSEYGSYKDCWYNNVELVTVDIGRVLEDPVTGKSFGPFIPGFAVSGNLKAIADKLRTTGVDLLAGENANGMPKSIMKVFNKLQTQLMFFAWESEHHNFCTRFRGPGNRKSKPTKRGSSVRVPAVGYAEYRPGNSNRRVFIHPYFNAQDIDKITHNDKVNKQWWPKSWDA